MRKILKTSDIHATITAHITFDESRPERFGLKHSDAISDKEDFTILSNEGSLRSGPPLKTDFFALMLCLQGTCKKTIGPFQVEIKPKTVHLVSPRYITSYRDREDDLQLYMILFKPQFLTKSFIKEDIIAQLLEFNPEIPPLYQLDDESFENIKYGFEKIDYEYKQNKAFNIQMIRLLLIQLLYEINRACETCMLSSTRHLSRQYAVVFNFKKLVDEHFLTKRTVQEYAQMMHLSPKYLLELVKNETGQTALNIIHNRIYLEAQYLLGLSTMNVREVADELGFDTSSHFSRFFKQFSGKTPLQYQLEQ